MRFLCTAEFDTPHFHEARTVSCIQYSSGVNGTRVWFPRVAPGKCWRLKQRVSARYGYGSARARAYFAFINDTLQKHKGEGALLLETGESSSLKSPRHLTLLQEQRIPYLTPCAVRGTAVPFYHFRHKASSELMPAKPILFPDVDFLSTHGYTSPPPGVLGHAGGLVHDLEAEAARWPWARKRGIVYRGSITGRPPQAASLDELRRNSRLNLALHTRDQPKHRVDVKVTNTSLFGLMPPAVAEYVAELGVSGVYAHDASIHPTNHPSSASASVVLLDSESLVATTTRTHITLTSHWYRLACQRNRDATLCAALAPPQLEQQPLRSRCARYTARRRSRMRFACACPALRSGRL